MVDACHIIPFSVSQDDTITNGICLSPTIHRAYDRSLITITEKYRVQVSTELSKYESNGYLLDFDQKPIRLPQELEYTPAMDSLLWHRSEVFRK